MENFIGKDYLYWDGGACAISREDDIGARAYGRETYKHCKNGRDENYCAVMLRPNGTVLGRYGKSDACDKLVLRWMGYKSGRCANGSKNVIDCWLSRLQIAYLTLAIDGENKLAARLIAHLRLALMRTKRAVNYLPVPIRLGDYKILNQFGVNLPDNFPAQSPVRHYYGFTSVAA